MNKIDAPVLAPEIKFSALKEFKRLDIVQKILVVVFTAIASIATFFLGMRPFFCAMVNHLKVMHPVPQSTLQGLQEKVGLKAPSALVQAAPTLAMLPTASPLQEFAPLIPFNHNQEDLAPLELAARDTHQVALSELNENNKLIALIQNGVDSGMIQNLSRFQVDQGLNIVVNNVATPIQVIGDCLKAKIKGGQCAYVVNAVIRYNDEVRPLQLAFLSKHDLDDTVSIGNLVLSHMEKRGTLSLKGKEDGRLSIAGNENTKAPLVRTTMALPQNFLDTLLSNQKIQTLRTPLRIENGTLKEKESKEDLKELAQDLDHINATFADQAKMATDARKAEELTFERSLEETIRPQDLHASMMNLDQSAFDFGGTVRPQKLYESSIFQSSEIHDAPEYVEDPQGSEYAGLGLAESSRLANSHIALEKKYANFVPILFQFLMGFTDPDNEISKIQNDDALAISAGTFVKAGGENPDAKASYQVIAHMLKETYGTSLTERVFGRYGINKKDTFTLKDLKKTMVGISANVTEKDLMNLFNHIKNDKAGNLQGYKAGDILASVNPELYAKITTKESFDQLTSEELNFLHSAFKTVPFQNERLNVADILDYLVKDAANDDFFYRHDVEGLKIKETWKSLDLTHPTLALGEFSGKSLAYQELKTGMILEMPEVNVGSTVAGQTPKIYKVHSSLENKDDAVIAHILSPVNQQQSVCDDGSEHAFLVFRGTLPGTEDKAGGASIYRDLHYRGIGRVAYEAREPEIKQMIMDYLANCEGDNVTMHLSGHSLGGCDTQRVTTTLMELVANAPDDSPLKKLKKVVVTTFNAPLVNQSVNSRLKDAVRTIKNKNIDIDVELNHLRFYDQSYEDIIQKFGTILLGADLQGGTGDAVFKDNSRFKRNIYKIEVQENLGLGPEGHLARHSYRTFNKALCTLPYKMTKLSSDVQADRKVMEKELAQNYHWDEEEMGYAGKIINNITWYTTWALREAVKVPHALMTGAHAAGLGANRAWNEKNAATMNERRAY